MQNKYEPKIYVACLAAYNNGHLHGAWIDAAQDADAIRQEIAAILAASPIPDAEEYAIHDYEDFGGVAIEEYSGIERVAALAELIAQHGRLGAELLAHFGGDCDDARDALEDRYFGCFASLADHMEELMDTTSILKYLRY